MTRTATRPYDCSRSTRRVPRARGVSAIAKPVIRIEVEGQTFEAELPERPVRVGKGEACDLTLGCAGVATEHCEIVSLPDGRHVLKDLGSGYPTRVNDIEAKQVSLKPGDVIAVGEARISYVLPEPEPVSEQPAAAGARAHADGTATAVRSEPAPVATRSRVSGHPLTGPMIALGVAAVVALVLAFVLGAGDDDDVASAERRLEHALDLYRARDYDAARAALETLSNDPSAASQSRRVDRYLDQTQSAIRLAENELEMIWTHRLDFDISTVATSRRVFEQKHGTLLAKRFDGTIEKVREAQAVWLAQAVKETTGSVDTLLDLGQYADAMDAWNALGARGHAGVDLTQVVDAGLASVDTRAQAAATKLLGDAKRASLERGPGSALMLLETHLAKFRGLPAYASLSQAAEAYQAEDHAASATQRPGTPTEEAPTPETPTPPDEAALAAAAKARAVADGHAEGWGFEQALAVLDQAIEGLGGPDAPLASDLADRRRDVALAVAGRDHLIEDILSHPERFRRIQTGTKFFVDLTSADTNGVTASVRGARQTYRWASMPSARAALIAGRSRASGEAALGVAALLREIGEADAAEPFLFAAHPAVADAVLFPLVARWRGEDVPQGGYVTYGKRLVTPSERERLTLLARIEDAVKRVRKKDPKTWKEAAEELLALGPMAREPLLQSLQARRDDVIDDLAKLKVFSSGRTKARLFDELEKRRAHALVLINDGQAWPYPNPSGRNTDEVVQRVDAVREVWERPFNVIVGWSNDAKDQLSMVTDVDEFLVRADSSYRPSLDAVRERVNREVDMPTCTPTSGSKSIREYSLKVLAYNEKVDTTATREEKFCVLAVNEYRMMMGHWAVKIEERLTRAARGHSHHMRVNEYFAHNVPANKGPSDANRTPGHRARAQGYGSGVGENIARGTWTGRDAFRAWFHSSGHHRNMINARWTEMGAGRSGGDWWTQLFGAASGKSLSLPGAYPAPDAFFAPESEDESGRPRRPGAPELPAEPPVVPPEWPDEEPGTE